MNVKLNNNKHYNRKIKKKEKLKLKPNKCKCWKSKES